MFEHTRHQPSRRLRPFGLLLISSALISPTLLGCANNTAANDSGSISGRSTTAPTSTAPVGFTDFRTSNPAWLTRGHATGSLKYPMSPPAGGDHNPRWQNCAGDVYDAPIANEHAVHSLEHGAVWVTYRPDLPADQVAALADRVRGRSYLLMSPYPGLNSPISLQAWGYQLKVTSAADRRIDGFINSYRMNASLEPGAPCSNGVSDTGSTPLSLGS